MATFKTDNLHGYSVKFSPFQADRLACVANQHYGLSGGGVLYILQNTPAGVLRLKLFNWIDGLFDIVWSEINPNIVLTASGDGSLQLWDLSNPQNHPVLVFKEHEKEVYSVDWNQTRINQHVISASWDSTIKLWDTARINSLTTFIGHSQLVYNAMWSVHIPNCFASVSADGTLKLWNTLEPQRDILTIPAHINTDVLSCDWCKYDENLIATSSSDGSIRGWDIRNVTTPAFEQQSYGYAVKRVQFSPHQSTVMASVSYDFTTRIWDIKSSARAIENIEHHTEFVYGIDFNKNIPGQIADCGWDSNLHIFTPNCLIAGKF